MGFLFFLVLTSAATATVLGGAAIISPPPAPMLTFTALAGPLPLYPGEVTNTWHHLLIPKGPIAISEFAADIVEKDPFSSSADDGEGSTMTPVPLSDAYLHHHVVNSEHKFHYHHHLFKSEHSHGVGFGAGTESRGTKQTFPYPYRFTTVEGEDELIANVHVINTRHMTTEEAHRCSECPCTAEDTSLVEQRKIRDWKNDTCNSALVEEENASCFPDTYQGGLYCCEHGEFCLDDFFMTKEGKEVSLQVAEKNSSNSNSNRTLQSIFYLRYVLTYTPTTPDVRPLYLAACCDASGDETHPGNIEYDIPKCNNNTSSSTKNNNDDDDCIHELETVQSLHGEATESFGLGGPTNEEDVYVDVVYMVGHLHRGGISMSSYFMNGTTLCISLPHIRIGAATRDWQ